MKGVYYVTTQAEGAWPNRSIVIKCNSDPTDATPDGTAGRIIGSIDVRAAGKAATYGYFVIWPDHPTVPVFTVDVNDDGTPRLERPVEP